MNPFGPGGFDLSKIDLNEVVRMLQSDGPVNWEIARQMATSVALGEEGGANRAAGRRGRPGAARGARARRADPRRRRDRAHRDLLRHRSRTLGRAEWALLHLDALAPVLEALAVTFRAAIVEESAGEELDPDPMAVGPFGMPMGGDALSGLMGMMAPVLLGVQAGSMVGYLAQHALGRYDLPLPASDPPSLCFVVRTSTSSRTRGRSIATTSASSSRSTRSCGPPSGRSRGCSRSSSRLATEYVSAYELDRDALESQLGGFDPTDPSSMSGITEHPEALLGAMRSPRQEEILRRLQAVTSVLEGYAEVVVQGIGGRLAGSFDQVHEALARHRVERGEAGRFIEGLLGLQLERSHYEQGQAFCRGVIERAGLDGLNRLWERESMLPTPAELDAPGLWLARIELPD